MPVAQRSLLLLVLIGTLFTGDSWASDYHSVYKSRVKIVNRGGGGHCHRCNRGPGQCTCAQPMLAQPIVPVTPPAIQSAPLMVPQTTMRPVYETQYRPQQVVTNRMVTETQYRTEAYTETVPVQTVQNVTVDEGHWQQVWVSKPVTKQVASTSYQQRTNCRVVPQQVTKCVPQVSTTMVPYQTVRYVPQQTCVPACSTALNSYPSVSSYPMPVTSTAYLSSPLGATSPYAYQPTPAYRTAYAPSSQFDTTPSSNLVPEPHHLDVPGATNHSRDFVPAQAIPKRGQPTSYADDAGAPRVSAAGRFSGVPSAAAVWRATSTR